MTITGDYRGRFRGAISRFFATREIRASITRAFRAAERGGSRCAAYVSVRVESGSVPGSPGIRVKDGTYFVSISGRMQGEWRNGGQLAADASRHVVSHVLGGVRAN